MNIFIFMAPILILAMVCVASVAMEIFFIIDEKKE
jgi:hypothetical protein